MIDTPWTVHTAGPLVGLIQTCASCGFVLEDHTAWAEGRVAVEVGNTAGPPSWPVGQLIGTDCTSRTSGGMTYVVEGRELADDEQFCVGAN